jgi:hypothetical protein
LVKNVALTSLYTNHRQLSINDKLTLNYGQNFNDLDLTTHPTNPSLNYTHVI